MTLHVTRQRVRVGLGALWLSFGLSTALSAQPHDGLGAIPNTPAGRVFAAFLPAYNSGSRTSLARFVAEHYAPGTDIRNKTDGWLELFYKYGPATPHGTSISKDRDLEMWLHGDITRAWFAVELILHSEADHIRAVGLLEGEKPEDAPPTTIEIDELTDHLDAYLHALDAAGYFAGTVLVAREGRPIYEAAFGLADRSDDVPIDVQTKFNTASLTKMFTGVAIAQLAEKGALSFDDPILAYVPEYPEDIGDQVTIHHLLTHTSGIELDEIPAFNAAKRNAADSEAVLRAHLRYVDSLRTDGAFSPLTEYDYSNEGFDLAGLIVERVSGQSLLDYFTAHIFEPADMRSTGRFPIDAERHNVATGYTHIVDSSGAFSEQEVPNTHVLDKVLLGSVGLYSTVRDLNRFANSLFSSFTLLNALTRNDVLSSQVRRGSTEAYGYGFTLATHRGAVSFGHNGGVKGASAELRHFPDGGYTVIVLAGKRTIAITISNYIRDLLTLD